MKPSDKALQAVDRRLRAMAEKSSGDDNTTLLAACGIIIELQGAMGRLKLIAERLAEFDEWQPETPHPDSEPIEEELCDWHNRLLLAVRAAQEIAKGKP